MNLTRNEVLDYKKWYKDKPEEGFSPKRNREVVEKSIQKAILMQENRKKDYIEQIRERTDAVATYLKSVAQGNEKDVDKYFGRRWLAYLRGQKIIEEVRGRMKRLLSLD